MPRLMLVFLFLLLLPLIARPELQNQESIDSQYEAGLSALNSGDYQGALNAFERVVLIDPRHAGAWLDLAVAYSRLGDFESALRILDHVRSNFNPSPELIDKIDSAKSLLYEAPRLLTRPNWRVELEAGLGWVKNVNQGLSDPDLVLTLGEFGRVKTSVEDSELARSDYASSVRASLFMYWPGHGSNGTNLVVTAGDRSYQNETDFRLTDLGVWAAHSLRLRENFDLQGGLSLRSFNKGGESFANFFGAQTGLRTVRGGCFWNPTIELENRTYRQEGYFDSNAYWVTTSVLCPTFSRVLFTARLGLDQPSGDRPGGSTQKIELQTYGKWSIKKDWAIEFLGLIARYKDKNGFSPILDSGADRKIDRLTFRAALEWNARALGVRDLDFLLHFDYQVDKSNIEIYSLSDRQIFLRLRYTTKGLH